MQAPLLPLPWAVPPPPSKGRGLRWQSWLGLDAISAAEQGSLAGSNFLIRTPGLPARWFSALTPLLRNHTPQSSPQTTHTHREPHVYESEGRLWGHHSEARHRREVLAKAPVSEARGEAQAPRSAPSHWVAQFPAPKQPTPPGLPQRERIPDLKAEKGSGETCSLASLRAGLTQLPRPQAECSAISTAHPLLAQLGWGQADGLSKADNLPQPEAAPVEGGLHEGRGSRGPGRGDSALRRHMWLDLKSY